MSKKDYTKFSEKSEKEVVIETVPTIEPEVIENVENLAVELANETGEDVTIEVTVGETTPEAEPVITPEAEPVITPEAEPVITPEVEPVTEVSTPQVFVGKVVPNKLNVRKEANAKAEVLDVLLKDETVQIDEIGESDFYKVRFTKNGETIEGYCMKQFISIE